MRFKIAIVCLSGALNAAAVQADVIVQEGEIGDLGEYPIVLNQFDDQGGTRHLNFIQIDLNSSMAGGFTTSGSGTPVFIKIVFDQDYYLDDQFLAGTHCQFQDTLANQGSAAYSFWKPDTDQAVIDDAGEMAPWIGDGTITLISIGDFWWTADPPEDILDCGAGLSADWTITYDYTILPPCPEDVTSDGVVDVLDLLEVLSQWGTAGSADVNGDGVVDVLDLLDVLSAWGVC